jgi:hypothetical protein
MESPLKPEQKPEQLGGTDGNGISGRLALRLGVLG